MTDSTLLLPSPAKVNLWLRVLGKRTDGFHEVHTRMCPLSLADEVQVTRKSEGVTHLTCSDGTVPTDESNLALKALRTFEKVTGSTTAFDIHLEKRIPHGAGLGGGSSNAATVLQAVNQLSGNPLDEVKLREIAAELGSDVPFFLYGCVCDASGRGEILTPVTDFPWKLSLVLIKPPFGIPTPWAYKNWSGSQELRSVDYRPQPCPWGEMVNDLERPVFEKWILLPTLKNWLREQPETIAALMSGSGSTVFAICHDEPSATSLAAKAQDLCGPTTQIFTVTTATGT